MGDHLSWTSAPPTTTELDRLSTTSFPQFRQNKKQTLLYALNIFSVLALQYITQQNIMRFESGNNGLILEHDS